MSRTIKVGITHGDINGVSYEIILKALSDERMCELCTPVIFGSAKLLAYFRKQTGIEEFRCNIINDASEAKDGEVNLVNITNEEFRVDAGMSTEVGGKAAYMSLESAVEALKAGSVDVLVTAPINKAAIHSDEFNFAGHTEYLADRLSENDEKPLMILFDDFVRVALVTTHLALKDVSAAITEERVIETVKAFNQSLISDFGIDRPRIAVLSLNPHCGDNGLLGEEEQTVITPAVSKLLEEGVLAFGPYAADGFFATDGYLKYDGVVAMYHDQGLAPFKALAENRGVNFTAGLPFVRTSPDHGTAYSIAGKNEADPTSMREAIYKAIDIYRCREAYQRASANPLRKQYEARGADKTIDLTKDEL